MVTFFFSLNTYAVECDVNELIIPIFNHPPHFLAPQVNGHQGDMVTYVEKYILKKMNIKWRWKKSGPSFKRIWQELLTCKYQLGVALAPIPEIKENFIYSSRPFALGVAAIAVPRSIKMSYIKSAKDLLGIKVGYFQAPKSFLPEILQKKTISLFEVTGNNSFERSVKMLKHSRIGAVFYPDAITLKFMLKKLQMLKKYKVIEINSPPIPGYFVIPKKLKNGEILMKKINKLMRKAPKTYNEYSRSR